MPTVTDIGTLVSCHPEVGGHPIIAGTKTSVRRIVVLYKQNASAEEIARRMSHLNIKLYNSESTGNDITV